MALLSIFKQMTEKERWLNVLPAIMISLVMSFTLFMYAPLSLYFSNKNEFWFDFVDIIPVLGSLFGICLVSMLALYFILFLIHKYAYYAGVVVGFIVYISTLFQGVFQTSYLPQIDGASVDWDALSIHRVSSIATWVIVTGLVVVIYKLFKFNGFKNVVNVVTCFCLAFFMVATVILGIENKGFQPKSDLCVTEKGITEYSSDTNFIIFLIDATDAGLSQDIMDENPEYSEGFKDFTFYSNMAGVYPFTRHSIPVILGGDVYYCDENFEDYLADTFRTSALFTSLKESGYDIQVYETLTPTSDGNITGIENIQNVSTQFDSFSDAMSIQTKMIGLRYAPFDLKRYCEVMPSEISVNRTTGRTDIDAFSDDNRVFLSELDKAPVIRDNKVFKFIHVTGSHYPFIYDENMNVVGQENSSYETCVRASLNMTMDYLDYLKENNLYDNSVIIIMADHGCSQTRDVYERSNPLFVVKGLGETHDEITFNDAPVSYSDLNEAYYRLINGSNSNEIFDWSEGDVRERQYLIYNCGKPGEEVFETDDIIHEYIIKGHASDFSQIVPTGKLFIYKSFSLLYIFDLFYLMTRNYGLAIILLTIVLKLLLTPMNVWIQKNSVKMVKLQGDINRLKIKCFGDKERFSQEVSELYKKNKYKPWASMIPMIVQLAIMMLLLGVIKEKAAAAVEMELGILNLGIQASVYGPIISVPVAFFAGLSALILCACQNYIDVLQHEQTKANKIGVMVLSVGLSVYLSSVVPMGVVLYWIISNLYAAVWVFVINAIINPKNYINYAELESTKAELKALESIGKKEKISSADKKREKQDYKKFFSIKNKHLVFYSESNGFYKYFKGFIDEILNHTDMPIHYITSDPLDKIFEMAKNEPRIKPYYIGEKKLIVLMMKMDADVVVMTMPDLENFHIKRSYVRDDIEYILVQHGMGSLNLTLRGGSMDHYDTVFCCGKNQYEEIRAIEKANNLNEKNLVDVGYPLFDDMIADYQKSKHETNAKSKILVAPSWQDGNIIESCLDGLLDSLKNEDYEIIVRPHPQHVRHNPALFDSYKSKYSENKNIEIQTDFSSNNPVLEADLLITDWSDIAWEFSFVTKRPTLFINTKMKIMNPDYEKIDLVPVNISARDIVGKSISPENVSEANEAISYLLTHKNEYAEAIDIVMKENLSNMGSSGHVGGKYIIDAVMNKIKARKEQA